MTRRVVVTGVGLVSAVGVGTEETWRNLLAGKSGVAPITHFDTTGFSATIAAEVKGFDPLQYVEKKDLKKMGLFIQFALAASQFAMEQAQLKLTPQLADRTGVYIGSGIGGFDVIEREHTALLQGGPRKISPFFIPAAIVNLAAGFVSIRWGAKGPNSATCTACSSSTHAVGDSFKLIQRCAADAMICGGAEAAITPMGVGGFAAMRALSTRNREPAKASRPFDRDRDGFVIGEGAGILILEELGSALKRDAPILAEVVGYGMSGDAFHITAPAEDADGAVRVMRKHPGGCQHFAGTGGIHQRARHLHALQRPDGNPGDQESVRCARGQTGYQLDQIDDRSLVGWRGRTGSRHRGARASRSNPASYH